VSPGDGDSVTMEFLPSGSDGWTTAEDGGELVLTGVCFGEESRVLGRVPAHRARRPGAGDRHRQRRGRVPARLTGKLDAQTATGSITFVDSGAVDAAVLTGTGEVRAVFVEEPKALSFDSGSSLLSVALPAGRYTLDLDTLGNTAVADEIVDGNGPSIRLHSGTGDIDLFSSN
jgi:ferric-dicitrate binding protein FerR (iron transport regulator)